MKIVAIGGEPGSGKSTLMRKLMEGKNWVLDENTKLVPHYFTTILVDKKMDSQVFIIGKGYFDDDGYVQGTDKMSMACQPKVIEWLGKLAEEEKLNGPKYIVVFEGDRLFSPSFLEHCVDNYDTQIMILRTEKDIRTNRYEERGSSQNLVWLMGRETKISNIRNNLNLMFNITQMDNNNIEEQADVIRFLKQKMYGEEVDYGLVGS